MKKLTEIEVSRLWQQVAKESIVLLTTDKQTVQVVYPGRPSDEPGADFKDAVISIDEELKKGDIEIHVKSSDWFAHQHHKKKIYNGIVLHVVMCHNTDEIIHLENGNVIPVIALDNQKTLKNVNSEIKSLKPCSATKYCDINSETTAKVLDTIGETRFREKQSAFMCELKRTEAGQCLYSGIMSALGYSRNSVPFQVLSRKLPLALLEEIIGETPAELIHSHLQAILLGSAGFLPGQESNNHFMADKDQRLLYMERDWQISQRNPELLPKDWHLFRVRPVNFPARRLVGIAHLIQRYQKHGLLAGLFENIELSFRAETWRLLEDALVVEAAGYWIDHFSPGKQSHKLGRFLIGPSRAAEILINIVLPFYAALADCGYYQETKEKAFEIYCSYPAITSNTIDRHMCLQLGLKPSWVNSARRRQGLLHLYKRFCTQGRCGECPLLVR